MIGRAPYRSRGVFPAPQDLRLLKRKILQQLASLPYVHFLDSQGFEDPYGRFQFLAAGAADEGQAFYQLSDLESAFEAEPDWYFGHICYEFGGTLEPGLPAAKLGRMGYPLCFFYRPDWLIYQFRGEDRIHVASRNIPAAALWEQIQSKDPSRDSWEAEKEAPSIQFHENQNFSSYGEKFKQIRTHLLQGNAYELNFCVEGQGQGSVAEPYRFFEDLCQRSPAPFSAFHQWKSNVMLGASPERYLCRRGDRIIAQPIKGTAARSEDPQEDHRRKEALRHSRKDQSENLMIVDLMRNDLSRCCIPGTVQVPELMEIYAFAQVFQMVSTIEGVQDPSSRMLDPIRVSFPMGSMTGAPKIEVMKLIQALEPVARELFSGTVGYISPEGDFDFNVNIRSLFYQGSTGIWSYQTGGAITYDSDPSEEWAERRTKARALETLFSPKD